MVRYGPSGWAHADWNCVVYPQYKPRGFHPLEHLSTHFNLIEIDASFEQPIKPEVAKLWLRIVERQPRFQFTALAGRQFTFDRNLDAPAVKRFKEGLWPLRQAGKLGCVLLRFPASLRFNKDNRDFLIKLRRTFHPLPLAAEMRHASWLLDEALGVMMDYQIGFCNVDQPAGPGSMPPKAVVTSALSYVRLLGRGASDWSDETSAGNYLYSPLELEDWQRRIDRLSVHTAETYVIAANSRGGKSVVNALQLSTGKKVERPAASTRHAA